MPYVSQNLRKSIEPSLQSIKNEIGVQTNPGTLNYIITELLLHKCYTDTANDKWLESQTITPTYQTLNELIGILECCKLELYRRLGTSIEKSAIKRNGDLTSFKK